LALDPENTVAANNLKNCQRMVGMIKLTDKDPYEVLGISSDADKKSIMAAFVKKNRGNNEDRRLARQAYEHSASQKSAY